MTVLWSDWSEAITVGVAGVRDADLKRAAEILLAADIVLTAGNGGSASLASHMAQAIAKPDYKAGGRRAVCLTDAVPTLTAHANDGGWAGALLDGARPFLRPGCAVVLFSSSGKSHNILRLAGQAVMSKCPVVAFTGFDGGPLKTLIAAKLDVPSVSLHVESTDYEVVEPVHDALLHRVQYHLRALTPSR